MKQLFGLPYSKFRIDSNLYNKQQIINSIEHNYKIDRDRNNWDTDEVYASKLHQSVNDFNNEKFSAVDFSTVIPLYQNCIQDFFNQLDLLEYATYRFRIVNYTCMSSGQFLKEHTHGSDFSAVHYINYDPGMHPPTCFVNGNGYSSYIAAVMPKLNKLLNPSNADNSWAFKHFSIPVAEDDFVIVPGSLEHLVPQFDSNSLRMTVVVNIDLD